MVLDLDMPIRVTEPDRRIDAVRGCVAVERGPLVYCIETADAPTGTEIENLEWDRTRLPAEAPRPDIAKPLIGVTVPVIDRGRGDPGADSLVAGAIPYFAWANRKVEAMRVWIPR